MQKKKTHINSIFLVQMGGMLEIRVVFEIHIMKLVVFQTYAASSDSKKFTELDPYGEMVVRVFAIDELFVRVLRE